MWRQEGTPNGSVSCMMHAGTTDVDLQHTLQANQQHSGPNLCFVKYILIAEPT